jgi:hypothetical protein
MSTAAISPEMFACTSLFGKNLSIFFETLFLFSVGKIHSAVPANYSGVFAPWFVSRSLLVCSTPPSVSQGQHQPGLQTLTYPGWACNLRVVCSAANFASLKQKKAPEKCL